MRKWTALIADTFSSTEPFTANEDKWIEMYAATKWLLSRSVSK